MLQPDLVQQRQNGMSCITLINLMCLLDYSMKCMMLFDNYRDNVHGRFIVGKSQFMLHQTILFLLHRACVTCIYHVPGLQLQLSCSSAAARLSQIHFLFGI